MQFLSVWRLLKYSTWSSFACDIAEFISILRKCCPRLNKLRVLLDQHTQLYMTPRRILSHLTSAGWRFTSMSIAECKPTSQVTDSDLFTLDQEILLSSQKCPCTAETMYRIANHHQCHCSAIKSNCTLNRRAWLEIQAAQKACDSTSSLKDLWGHLNPESNLTRVMFYSATVAKMFAQA